jgi:alpha-glucosidase/alpha-D-xyloside xylohydrolase
MGTQYLWGRDLLIAPVFEKGATSRDVYLPAGDWYDWWTNAKAKGGQTVSRSIDLATMPIYVRAGAIIPVDPVRQHTGEAVTEPTTLKVYRGANGTFTMYDDDGISQDYLRGRGSWTRWSGTMAREVSRSSRSSAGSTNVGLRVSSAWLVPDGSTQTVRYGPAGGFELPGPKARTAQGVNGADSATGSFRF